MDKQGHAGRLCSSAGRPRSSSSSNSSGSSFFRTLIAAGLLAPRPHLAARTMALARPSVLIAAHGALDQGETPFLEALFTFVPPFRP
eukprot:scaffold50122_cov45-Phaeocystis_antarctica.AAC.1